MSMAVVVSELLPAQEAEQIDVAFLATWLHGKSAKTQMAYHADIRRFYAHVCKPLADVRLSDLQSFVDSLADLKVASRKRTTAAVKSCLSFALKTGYLPLNVGIAVKLPKAEDTLAERIMSETSMDDILRLETNARNHAILVLLYYGGLRCSELCNLTWRNLQERDATGQIAVYGKGEKTRFVLLDGDTWREVWALRRGATLNEYVFTSRQSVGKGRTGAQGKASYRLTESRVWQIVHEAGTRAGVALNADARSRVSPHWFRHAHATHALEAGASIAVVKAVLGHSSVETTLRYTHVRPTDSTATVLRKRRSIRT